MLWSNLKLFQPDARVYQQISQHLTKCFLGLYKKVKICTHLIVIMITKGKQNKELAWSLDRESWPSSAKYCLSFKEVHLNSWTHQ